MTLAVVAALLLTGSPPTCALPPLRGGPLPWKAGEKLSYDIDVMGVVKGGAATVEVERPLVDQIALQARVHNTSVFAKIRRVSATALSWLDRKSLRPIRYRDEVLDNDLQKRSDVRWRAQAPQTTLELVMGGQPRTVTFSREGEAIDLLALIYYLRAADLRPGATFCFDLMANFRYWRFRGTVATTTEQIETALELFDTQRIDATVTRADDPKVKRIFHLWISTDPRRLPVAAVSEIDMGPVRAMLSRISGITR